MSFAHHAVATVSRLVVIYVAAVCACSEAFGQNRSEIRASDLVRFAEIGNPESIDWTGLPSTKTETHTHAPDGRHVAVVVSRGNPESHQNDAEILVYRTDRLLHGANASVVAKFSSATSSRPISQVKWLKDSQTLVFAGTQGDALSQVYKVGLDGYPPEQVTWLNGQLLSYAADGSATRIVTFVSVPRSTIDDVDDCRSNGCLVAARSVQDAQNGGGRASTVVTSWDMERGRAVQLPGVEDREPSIDQCNDEFSGGVSPDGRFGIRLCRLRSAYLPGWWRDYTISPTYRSCVDRKNARCFRKAYLIDLATGQSRSISDAPFLTARGAVAIWIDGGRGAIIPSAPEPLLGVDRTEYARRASRLAVHVLDPVSGRLRRVAELSSDVTSIDHAEWSDKQRVLSLHVRTASRASSSHLYLREQGGRWKWVDKSETIAHILPEVRVEQSLDRRPTLVAEGSDRQRRIVLDPNQWLDDYEIGRATGISWNAADGSTWKGVLYYPPGYKRDVRYPLVIQTGILSEDLFSLWGYTKNYPGRALATRGFLVLQMDQTLKDVIGTHREWPRMRAGFEGAIDVLDARGLIDRARVGMIGWSRGSVHMGHILSHSDYDVAAAAITEGGDYGIWSYVRGGHPESWDSFYGSPPIGLGLKPWLEGSTTFNLERVRSPLLMWMSGEGGVGSIAHPWDLYVGLRRAGVPVEYWYLPTGTHELYQVSHRISTVERLVDWFCFWLNGEEDPDLEKAEQYERWRAYRQQHKQILARPRPPLLRWSATPIAKPQND